MSKTSFDLAAELLAVVKNRHTKEHAASDCNIVLDPKWSKSKPTFLYGIAHNLRHAARRIGLNPKLPEGMRDDLLHLMDWADDFFWLSGWSLTGKLTGTPELKPGKPPGAFLLLALQQSEWAGLLNELHWYLMQIPDIRNLRPRVLWSVPEGGPKQEKVFQQRVIRRLETAEVALETFENRGGGRWHPDADSCLKDLRRHILIERARNHFLASICEPATTATQTRKHALLDLDSAAKLANIDRDKDFIKALKAEFNKGKKGMPFKGAYEREIQDSFQPLAIFATWIMDLLGNDYGEIVHPRTCFRQKELPPTATARDFPNIDAIRRIEKKLSEHRGWLKFAYLQENFAEVLGKINKAEEEFTSRAYLKTEAPPKFGNWDLFVLRDWASYTPLVPPRGKRAKRFGGGYFLRTPSEGIAIDPGYDFIENLYAAGLSIAMITDVIVTHEHYDHVASFGPLLTLLYEYFKERARKKLPPKKVNFLVCRNVLDHHARLIVDLGKYGRIEPLTDMDADNKHNHKLTGGTKLFCTHTEHGTPSGFGRGGVGLKFEFGDGVATLGITSDTGWYPELATIGQFKQGDDEDPAVMVLHVGSLKPEELQDSGYYKTHLGARGVFRIVDALEKCKLAVLGEFGEECINHRAWFANRINDFFRGPERNRADFKCLPSDRATRICARGNDLFISRKDDFKQPQPYLNIRAKEVGGKIKFTK